MCILEETIHIICGHWGNKRNVSPCAIALTQEGFSKSGCWYSETSGVGRLNTKCPTCKRAEVRKSEGKSDPFADLSAESRGRLNIQQDEKRHGLREAIWEPFADFSAESCRQFEIRQHARRLGFQKYYPWVTQLDMRALGRRRSFPR